MINKLENIEKKEYI